MPISMIRRAPGMPVAYDEIIAQVAEPLCSSEGFISNTAQITPDGVTVTEVWETHDQWETLARRIRQPAPPARRATGWTVSSTT